MEVGDSHLRAVVREWSREEDCTKGRLLFQDLPSVKYDLI